MVDAGCEGGGGDDGGVGEEFLVGGVGWGLEGGGWVGEGGEDAGEDGGVEFAWVGEGD